TKREERRGKNEEGRTKREERKGKNEKGRTKREERKGKDEKGRGGFRSSFFVLRSSLFVFRIDIGGHDEKRQIRFY
ncbi:MAG: FAD-dependent oxidoreductase, partial [Cyanobacteriota bacterium]